MVVAGPAAVFHGRLSILRLVSQRSGSNGTAQPSLGCGLFRRAGRGGWPDWTGGGLHLLAVAGVADFRGRVSRKNRQLADGSPAADDHWRHVLHDLHVSLADDFRADSPDPALLHAHLLAESADSVRADVSHHHRGQQRAVCAV